MFKVQYKEPIWLEDKVVKTRFALTQDEPYRFNTVTIDGDHRESSENVLIELGLDVLFKEWYVDKAMPEAIQRVDEMNAKMLEVDSFLNKAKADFQSIRERSDLSQGSITELTEMVFDLEVRVSTIEGVEVNVEENLGGGE